MPRAAAVSVLTVTTPPGSEGEFDEALAVLRAHAYATGRTVDDLAADVVTGRLDPGGLFGGDDTGG